MYSQTTAVTHLNDPYVYQALQKMKDQHLAVRTTRGTVHGMLKHVTPDHILLDVSQVPFFIRNQEIVWVAPAVMSMSKK